MNHVNVLLCPYNYLINPSIRKRMGLNINNAIIVFDEGHHIEKVAEEECSLYLSKEDLEYSKMMLD